MIATERKRIAAKIVEPPRCSDYDTECAGVMDHTQCHAGGIYTIRHTGEQVEVSPADGYCPYLGTPKEPTHAPE